MMPLDPDLALKWLQSIHPRIESILLQYQCGNCTFDNALAKIVPYVYQWYSQSPRPWYYRQLYATIASILQQLHPCDIDHVKDNKNE